MLTFTPIALVRHSSHFAVRKVQSTAEALNGNINVAVGTSLTFGIAAEEVSLLHLWSLFCPSPQYVELSFG